jgi:hypothetical protein
VVALLTDSGSAAARRQAYATARATPERASYDAVIDLEGRSR